MKFPSVLRNRCRRFAEYTSVAGCGQVQRSTHLAEVLFWLATIVAGVCLTVLDCATPITAYWNEASLSTINVVYNETVFFPGSAICVQVDTAELRFRNLSALFDEAALASFSACLRSEACYKEPRFLDTFTDQIFASAKVLSKYNVIENVYSARRKTMTGSLDGIPEAFIAGLLVAGDDVPRSMLAKALAYTFCARMNMTITYSRKDKLSVSDVCSEAALVWFGVPPKAAEETDLLCYNIEPFTRFREMNEKYELSFNPHAVLGSDGQRTNEFAYLSFDHVPIVTDETSNYVVVPFDRCVNVEVELATRITLLSKRRRPCDEYVPFLMCYGRCTVEEIGAQCNCSSVSWELYLNAAANRTSCISRFVLPAHYEEVCSHTARHKRRLDGGRMCSDECVEMCEKNMFNLVQSSCQWVQPQNSTTIVYRLYKRFYSHIEEQFTYSASTLFSSIGGILGLWLGAGFIGILEAVMFLPKVLFEYVCERKLAGVKNESGATQTTELCQRMEQLETRLDEELNQINMCIQSLMKGKLLPENMKHDSVSSSQSTV